MSGEDPVAPRVKRMLPSVSEVLKELTTRAQVEPDVAFRAAREVCAEELKRIRDVGGDSVPLEELVQRAYQRATGAYSQSSSPVPLRPPAPPPPAFDLPPEPPAPPAEQGAEDPFSETAGAMDLRWDREGREPFTEQPHAGAPATAGALREAFGAKPVAAAPTPTLKLPLEPTLPAPPPFAGEAGEAASWQAEPPAPEPEPEAPEGPGDETLGRLSREAESIDLRAVLRGAQPHGGISFPAAPPEPVAQAASPEAAPPARPPFEDEDDTVLTVPRGARRAGRNEGGSRAGIVIGTVVGLVALAALGYLLVGLWLERDAVPAPVAVARPRPTRAAGPAAKLPGVPSAPASLAVPPAPASATASPVPSPSAPPAPSPAATVAPRVAVAVPPLSVARTPLPTPPAPSVVSTARPQLKAPGPAPVTSAPATPVAALPAPAASAPVRQSRDGLVVTKDRAGQPQVFSIHFTSYRDRAAAERDLKRIEALVGRRGFVAEVDLGEKGVWQRVMIGAFATQQEAKGVREELAAKGTRDLGWVYRVVSPEAAGPR